MDEILQQVLDIEKKAERLVKDAEKEAAGIIENARREVRDYQESFQAELNAEFQKLIDQKTAAAEHQKEERIEQAKDDAEVWEAGLRQNMEEGIRHTMNRLAFPKGKKL